MDNPRDNGHPMQNTTQEQRNEAIAAAHANAPFAQRILAMNVMYKLPINSTPTLGTPTEVSSRLQKFYRTLDAELQEINDVANGTWRDDADQLAAIADVLGDIVVYCRSEALKYGIPLEEVLDIIMDSNQSKLGADGQPIYDENGKFLKGPNYWKPEPKIRQLLLSRMKARNK